MKHSVDDDDDDGDVKIEEIKKHTGNSSALVLSICTEKSKANLNRHIFVLKIISLLRYNISVWLSTRWWNSLCHWRPLSTSPISVLADYNSTNWTKETYWEKTNLCDMSTCSSQRFCWVHTGRGNIRNLTLCLSSEYLGLVYHLHALALTKEDHIFYLRCKTLLFRISCLRDILNLSTGILFWS